MQYLIRIESFLSKEEIKMPSSAQLDKNIEFDCADQDIKTLMMLDEDIQIDDAGQDRRT